MRSWIGREDLHKTFSSGPVEILAAIMRKGATDGVPEQAEQELISAIKADQKFSGITVQVNETDHYRIRTRRFMIPRWSSIARGGRLGSSTTRGSGAASPQGAYKSPGTSRRCRSRHHSLVPGEARNPRSMSRGNAWVRGPSYYLGTKRTKPRRGPVR